MPPESIKFRQAVGADAEAMYALHKASVFQLCRHAYSEIELNAWFFGRSPDIYQSGLSSGEIEVACIAGQVVGFVGAIPGEVTLLFVDPVHSGRGFGRALFERGLSKASQGFVGQLLVVATRNSAPLYRRYGFRPVERVALVRGDPAVNIEVIRMERPSNGSPNPSIERTSSSCA
ncbi:GNAT family N-acetyltransferase [Ideonella sp. BN130291]|uniref:GNAT family N-acetyltransferase n=1 Tax=Ideonella sp. BN130291 TaxID=3112940 RepID=UPI002E262631|nr:GNAT family N-acetyltransferase [Ideonella sp. BN130291]